MGLLSRAARGAKAALRDTGLPTVPLGNAAMGGLAGGIIGAGGSPYRDDDGGHGLEGALLGAALGGGLGLAGGARQFARNLPFEMRHGAGSVLNDIKQEALKWVRDPSMQQRVLAAQTPDEVKEIIEFAVSRSRSRLTEGGY
jgi:hypothetical protein